MDIDWEYLINMATLHRLRPLLYVNLNSVCSDDVPEGILGDLKSFYHRNASKNLLFTGELFKILKILNENEINVISYKGPVLASQAYENLSLREFGDIDLFIDKKDALKIKEVMQQEGYELYPPLNFKEDSYYLKFITEHCFINKSNNIIIEIKWRFEGDFISFPKNPDILRNNIHYYDLNGFRIPTFSSESQVLVLAVHAAKHDWTKISWICDISEIIQKGNIDWKKSLKIADELSIKRILLVNVFLAHYLFNLSIPAELKPYIKSDPSTKRISLKVRNKIFLKQEISLNLFEKFFLDCKKRENMFYGLKDNFNSLTKPGYKDFNDFPLPKQLFPLYHIIRPFILLKRYGKEPL